MSAKPAVPKYTVGEIVNYYDRQDRYQTGRVRHIEANWAWKDDPEPYLIYSLDHPTYRNRNFYASEKDIVGSRQRNPDR